MYCATSPASHHPFESVIDSNLSFFHFEIAILPVLILSEFLLFISISTSSRGNPTLSLPFKKSLDEDSDKNASEIVEGEADVIQEDESEVVNDSEDKPVDTEEEKEEDPKS